VVVPQRAAVEVLSQVGTRVWGLIDGCRTVAEILHQLAEEYEVDPRQLESDVREFVDSLERAEMLMRDGGEK